MDCPKCGRVNPPDAVKCDCGWDSIACETPAFHERPTQPARRNWRVWALAPGVLLLLHAQLPGAGLQPATSTAFTLGWYAGFISKVVLGIWLTLLGLEDVIGPSQSSRPAKIKQALTLLYVTLGAGLVRLTVSSEVDFVTFAVVGLNGLFLYMIGKGRDWARITFLVLFIFGIPLAGQPLLQWMAATPDSGPSDIAQAVIQGFALVLLFQKPSSDWFRRTKTAARGA